MNSILGCERETFAWWKAVIAVLENWKEMCMIKAKMLKREIRGL